jgi:nucleoside phosphorylase
MSETDGPQPKKKLSRNDYTIGWICALSIELAASAGMLDEVHPDIGLARGDKNMYTLGAIAGHNIVIACLPEGSMGIVPAATVASNMLRSFPRIRFGLMVGIGGGAPARRARPSEDIRLGDVVVSVPLKELGGVVKYDRGKVVAGGEFEHTGLLNMPPAALTNAVSKLRSVHETKRTAVPRYVEAMIKGVMAAEDANPDFEDQYRCPDIKYDQLFEADYEHVEQEAGGPESDKEWEFEGGEEEVQDEEEDDDDEPLSDEDEDATPLPCPHCEKARLIPRKPRKVPGPVIHYGTIASADQVMRHAQTRDKIRKKFGVLCFEMEAAGLMNDFPCLVIRGICDYSDTHKHKIWQRYAAATAAAYAKELLQVMLKDEIELSEDALQVLERGEQET